jgi:hypothetical protein
MNHLKDHNRAFIKNRQKNTTDIEEMQKRFWLSKI